jgi:hypothetical protein
LGEGDPRGEIPDCGDKETPGDAAGVVGPRLVG